MTVTISGITCRLTYLQNMMVAFGDCPQIRKNVAALQLSLVQLLETDLSRKVEAYSTDTFTKTELDYANSKSIIPIIKSIRERFGYSLKEAKDYVIANLEKVGFGYADSNGCAGFRWKE